ncbi:hypothetical protein NDS46_29910 (plasmid) [Paenibacillus thiaminolyticus]|uniref:hypothetical protein n=1 Tax=Paenibacillus thiaminolyticus TaxID=49283 RepID=UPI00232C36D9|nr:hypothetical protein [Paenibacillus thiaminolyticus]WCF11564.1 hypothetical protein NDS46_29910 [Paenibacillus thiaminolyticus]
MKMNISLITVSDKTDLRGEIEVMTAINFIYEENQVSIYMDTLSLDEKRKPFKFVSKIYPIPHLRSVICGTGNVDVIMDWVYRVQRNVVAADIEFLSSVTTEQLLEIHKKYNTFDVCTTIYQFGYSQIDEKFKGYVYRSTNNFSQEEYDYSFAIKPHVEFDWKEELKNGLDNAFIKLMTKQKEMDDKSLTRLGIGGEIHKFFMTKDAYYLGVLHRFSDYMECYDQILENLKSR